MGTDNLHHKRKARTAADLRRKEAKKSPYGRVLIVCEGEATEINYFSSLINKLRLTTANAVAVPSPSTCPNSNVSFGLEQAKSGDWDLVFCVFDKDAHTKFAQAVQRLNSTQSPVRAGYSAPCFEYWLLLHFTYTDKSFYGNPDRSPAECVIRELKKYIPDYTKGGKGVCECTYDSIEQAKAFAKRVNRSVSDATDSDAMTLVVEVVQALQDLRAQMDA